jgi:hypothetical protein
VELNSLILGRNEVFGKGFGEQGSWVVGEVRHKYYGNGKTKHSIKEYDFLREEDSGEYEERDKSDGNNYFIEWWNEGEVESFKNFYLYKISCSDSENW